MLRRMIHATFATVLALALVIPAMAAPHPMKSGKAIAKSTMILSRSFSVGGTELKAGTYDISADDAQVTVRKDGKVLAQAPITWKDADQKTAQNSLVLDGDQVKEVRFAGKTRIAVLQ
ncbi:MAG: hypothetical protein ACRD50_05255 [Candidatus Acidiferrales bacterium]